MQAVILAGGKGTRLHPLTSSTPKPMVNLFDKPVLEHTVELLKRHGIRDIVITLAYKADQIIDHFGGGTRWGVNIQYALEDMPKGTAGGLRSLQPVLSDTFVVISGDAVTDFDLSEAIDFHRKRSSIATMLLYSVDDPSQFGIVETESDGRIQRFLEKPKATETFTNTVNTGIYVLEPEVINSIPFDTVYDFSRDLFPKFLQNREPFYAVRADGYWCDVGNLAQYRNVHFDAMTGKIKLNIPGAKVADGVWLGTDAEIHPSVRLISPLYVGSGTSIEKDVELGRFAVIGNLSMIGEQAQVSQSVVGARTKIGQHSQVFGSVLGNGYKLADGRHLDDEIVVDDGSHMELRAEINSQHLIPVAADAQFGAWSALDIINLANRESVRPLAA